MELTPSDTRIFLFHNPTARQASNTAMDAVNAWLGKDRSQGAYANLRIQRIAVTPDGADGVFVSVVCTLGMPAVSESAASAPPPANE